MKVDFTIPGPPVPAQRVRKGKKRSGAPVWYLPEPSASYQTHVATIARAAASMVKPSWRADCERFGVELFFYKSDRRHRDIDNLMKNILDACNKVLYVDDSRIVRAYIELDVDRVNPRTHVIVYTL